ncbi:MAG TPA: hypothetical protein VHN16_12125 [Streptosporangiaceae bacterium]|nr:hypothetical protein [Streptosporangiaceae bacterium]
MLRQRYAEYPVHHLDGLGTPKPRSGRTLRRQTVATWTAQGTTNCSGPVPGGDVIYDSKHAIYTSFNGPGSNGMSIDDFFGPEIDSQAVEPNGVPYPVDDSWTADNAATKQYDSYKVQAVINWINGYEHSGKGPKVGTPAIYGMNFQTVSTAEKLKSSPAVLIGPNAQGKYTEGPSLAGGYVTVNGQQVPGPLLQSALSYVNDALQRMAGTIQADGEADSTAPQLSARPGGSMRPENEPGRQASASVT